MFCSSGLSFGSLLVEDIIHGFDIGTWLFLFGRFVLSGAVHDVTYQVIGFISYLLVEVMGNRLLFQLLHH